MATVDELNFRLIIDDSEFNQKVKDVKATAEQLNRDLSDILDIKNKVTRIGKDDVASAKQQNQILKDNAKTQEAIAREVEKTAQANRKLRATTDSNITREQAVDQEKIAQATIKTATAQERLNQLIKRGSGELNRHSKLWQQIKNLSTVYFSVAGASRMISALVRTTAEFELQRTTLGAILQDVEKANVLYEQMKELAVKSPFNFKELATYAKQLSAYSIPVDQLYDTTKMLADVSAGLGVGMDRLVLAYGQIRSASFLRGQEVRQLTEAGIPILEELRKQFVELGEEGITVGDVFDKISKRLVPFEMVSKVFTDMTSEGGKFYQMQEVQAETLRGKLSNLKDAFQIMLSEIGENQDGLLKGSVNALRSLAENYEKVGRLVVTLVSTYGAYKAALIGIRIWQSAEVLAMTKGIGAYKKLGKAIEIAITQSKAFAAIQKALSKINPWVAIGAAVAGLAIHFIQVGAEARKFRKELEQMANTKFTEADKSVETFQRLAKQLKNSTEGSQAYRDAISQLNRQYGDYLPNLLNEKNALTEILAVENEVTNAIYARAKAYASEEGMRKIEDKYGEDVRTKGDVLVGVLKNYWANPSDYGLGIIGEEAASTFLKGFRDALEKDDGDAVKIFEKEMTDFFGWAPKNFDESLIRKYARAVRSMYDETERFEKSIDRQFGSQGYSSFIEASVLKPIESAFNKAKQELDSTTMSVDEYNEALNGLKLNRLYQIKAAYEQLDAESGKPGSYLNKIKEIQAQIDALKPKDLGWLQKLVNPLVTGKGNNDLKAQIEDGYDEYVDRLLKEYKAVTEVYENSEKTYQKLNEDKANGVAIEEDIIKKATEQNELYKERKNVIEAIADKLGVSDALEGKSSKKSGASEYDARIRAWKREAATVKEFMDTYKRWKDLDIMSDEQIISNLREIYKNTTMVESAEKKVSQTLFERIKREEGFREKAYKDTGGVWTIGYGFTKGVKEGDTITREEAEKRLKEEIEAHSQYLKSLLASGVKMSQNQYEALLDLAYNAGEGAVKSLYEKFDGNMQEIGEHLLDYRIKDRAGKVLQGLIARREREYEMFFEDSVLDSEEQEPDKLILDFDRKINGIINKFKALGDKGKEAAAQVEDMFGKAGRKERTKDIEDAFKAAQKEAEKYREFMKDWLTGTDLEGEGSEYKLSKIVSDYSKALDKIANKADDARKKLYAKADAEKKVGTWSALDFSQDYNEITDKANEDRANALTTYSEKGREALKKMYEEWRNGAMDFNNLSDKTLGQLKSMKELIDGFSTDNADVFSPEVIENLKKLGLSLEEAQAIIEKLKGQDIGKISFDIKKETISQWQAIVDEISNAANAVKDYADAIGNDDLSSAMEGLIGMSEIASSVLSRLAQGDGIGAIVAGVSALFQKIMDAFTASARLKAAIAEAADEAERANAALQLSKGVDTIFGENTLAKMRNAVALMREYRSAASQDSIQANKKITWKSGLFNWGRSSKSLSDMVSELGYTLYDVYGNLNTQALQAILDTYDTLTTADREWIESAIKNAELYTDAVEELDAVLTDIFGQTIDSVTDALIESWKQAGNAALDYTDILDEVATAYARMILKAAVIDQVFTPEVEARIKKLSEEGDYEGALALTKQKLEEVNSKQDVWNKILSDLDQYFSKSSENAGNLADGIKGITEDTANLLASYLNAIRADVSFNKTQITTISTDIKQILGLLPASPTLNDYLNQIQANTFDTAQSNREILTEIRSMMGLGGEGSALRVITT